jgi:hypothetical protein
MSALWTVPVLAVVAGIVLVIVQLRSAADAAAGLTDSLRRVNEVRGAVHEVRRQGGICGHTASHVRSRPFGTRSD